MKTLLMEETKWVCCTRNEDARRGERSRSREKREKLRKNLIVLRLMEHFPRKRGIKFAGGIHFTDCSCCFTDSGIDTGFYTELHDSVTRFLSWPLFVEQMRLSMPMKKISLRFLFSLFRMSFIALNRLFNDSVFVESSWLCWLVLFRYHV